MHTYRIDVRNEANTEGITSIRSIEADTEEEALDKFLADNLTSRAELEAAGLTRIQIVKEQ